MILAAIADIPVAIPLPEMQKQVIHKKLSGESLTASEYVVDMTRSTEPSYRFYMQAKLARIFSANQKKTIVFDCTVSGVISFKSNCPTNGIYLKGRHFVATAPGAQFTETTEYLIARDSGRPDQYTLEEKRVSVDDRIVWLVNTRLMLWIRTSGMSVVHRGVTVQIPPFQCSAYLAYPVEFYNPLSIALVASIPARPSRLDLGVQGIICSVLSRERVTDQILFFHNRTLVTNPAYRELFLEKKKRIHDFEDPSVKLLDFTDKGIASTLSSPDLGTEHLCLNGIKTNYPIIWAKNPVMAYSPFTSHGPYFTSHMIVRNIPNRNWILIERWLRSSPENPFPSTILHYVNLDPEAMIAVHPGGERHYPVYNSLPEPSSTQLCLTNGYH